MRNYESWSLVFAGLSALGTLVAGIGAVAAVLQIRKHWRDDDTFATIIADDQSFETNASGHSVWMCKLRIVNSGKTDISLDELSFCDERMDQSFYFGATPRTEYPLCQGAYVESWASVIAKEHGVPLPESFAIKVQTVERKPLGIILVKKADARPTIQLNARKPH